MIFARSELPVVGGAQERLKLDFKATIRPKRTGDGEQWPHFEMAKDAAAFANAYGGTALVGARENSVTGALASYVPLSEPDAHRIKVEIQKAICQRCVPVPLHDVVVVESDVGFVVAANVWASPDQPIGVKVAGGLADGFGGDCFVFPLRTATNTTMLAPNQLPLLIHAPSRRVAVLLENIGAEGRREMKFWSRRGDLKRLDLLEVRAMENVAVFVGCENQGLMSGKRVAVPLDSVKSVWREVDGRWAVVADGVFSVGDVDAKFFPKMIES